MSDFEEAALVIIKEDDEKRGRSSLGKLLDRNPKLIYDIGHNGFTLLHYALRNYRFSIGQQLVNRGAPVNATTFSGESTLRLCSKTSTSDEGMAFFQMLVSEGAKYTPKEELTELIRSGKPMKQSGGFNRMQSWLMHGIPQWARICMSPPGSERIRAWSSFC